MNKFPILTAEQVKFLTECLYNILKENDGYFKTVDDNTFIEFVASHIYQMSTNTESYSIADDLHSLGIFDAVNYDHDIDDSDIGLLFSPLGTMVLLKMRDWIMVKETTIH